MTDLSRCWTGRPLPVEAVAHDPYEDLPLV